MEIKPIETIYNGYRFRSRLEARWAVFFDALGVPYEYEPEGFDLGNGLYYLPDFRVKCYGTRTGFPDRPAFDLWIEVKGKMTEKDAEKLKKFSYVEIIHEYGIDEVVRNPILVVSDMPNGTNILCYEDKFDEFDTPVFNYRLIDGDYFGAYPSAINGKFILMGADSNYMSDDAIKNAGFAYEKAKQARFEHGETPTT